MKIRDYTLSGSYNYETNNTIYNNATVNVMLSKTSFGKTMPQDVTSESKSKTSPSNVTMIWLELKDFEPMLIGQLLIFHLSTESKVGF